MIASCRNKKNLISWFLGFRGNYIISEMKCQVKEKNFFCVAKKALQVMFCDKVAKVMFASQMMLFALLTVMFCALHKVKESGKPRNATFPLNNSMVQNYFRK